MTDTTQNPVAVVTGASSGIGEATARALAAGGPHLPLTPTSTDQCADGLTNPGPQWRTEGSGAFIHGGARQLCQRPGHIPEVLVGEVEHHC